MTCCFSTTFWTHCQWETGAPWHWEMSIAAAKLCAGCCTVRKWRHPYKASIIENAALHWADKLTGKDVMGTVIRSRLYTMVCYAKAYSVRKDEDTERHGYTEMRLVVHMLVVRLMMHHLVLGCSGTFWSSGVVNCIVKIPLKSKSTKREIWRNQGNLSFLPADFVCFC